MQVWEGLNEAKPKEEYIIFPDLISIKVGTLSENNFIYFYVKKSIEKYRENIFRVFTDKTELYFVSIKNNRMWRLQHNQKKLGQRQNKTEKVNTVVEGSTIGSLTGNRWGYQDWV